MDFSANFTLDQLCHSDTALRLGIENKPNAGEIANLHRLCDELLEPAQSILGVPLHINSGYRSPSLNQAIGGASNSAHMDGRAADCTFNGLNLHEVFDTLRRGTLPYDQIIFECDAWIHLAIARSGETPRRQAMQATGGPGAWKYQQVS